MPLSLAKKNIIGEHAFHVFIKDGVEIRVPCSLEEYAALGLKGAGAPPTPEGYTWKLSFRDNKFDTPSGFLEDGQYAEENGRYVVKLAGHRGRISVFATDIIDDVISDKGIERVRDLNK